MHLGLMGTIRCMAVTGHHMNLHINPQWFEAAWIILDRERGVSVREIQDATCKYFSVKRSEMFSQRKNQRIANARMVAMYLACEKTDLSLPEIGRMFHRDHTTIYHGHRKIEKRRLENEYFESAITELSELLEGAKHD